MIGRPPKPLEDRFWSKVGRTADPWSCWKWTGSLARNGYGGIRALSPTGVWITVSAHRIAWELRYGPVPPGLFVCHRCDVRSCVNQNHLFLGTHMDNMADMVAKHRQVKGDRHWAIKHPEKLARGDRSGARLHPERRPRGARVGTSKLTELQAHDVIQATGTFKEISRRFGISDEHVARIKRGLSWAHLQEIQ